MTSKPFGRKPIIFVYFKEVLQTVVMSYFAVNHVFGEMTEESEFCKKGWSEFKNDRKQWEKECLNVDSINMSWCCNETAEYLEYRYESYIKCCPIMGRYLTHDC